MMKTKQQATKASDCISRQATIDVLHEYFDGMLETDTWSPCDVYGLIEILPSAECKKGKWIVYESSDGLVRRCTCDQCGYETHGKQWRNPNFCPNCGCQMKGEEDE